VLLIISNLFPDFIITFITQPFPSTKFIFENSQITILTTQPFSSVIIIKLSLKCVINVSSSFFKILIFVFELFDDNVEDDDNKDNDNNDNCDDDGDCCEFVIIIVSRINIPLDE
jgi:hypothetical protein